MRIAIIGGKLQGLEAVYLANKAGFETFLIDKNPQVPARGICHTFVAFEFSPEGEWPGEPEDIDLIFPAMEDSDTLALVQTWADHLGVPLAFDSAAFQLSKSKYLSNALFTRLGLPVPRSWPGCEFPVVVKPDQASGSQGVVVIAGEEQLSTCLKSRQDKVIIQEYVEGPSYSVEVIGKPGAYAALQVTDLFMDRDHDCMRVTAPTVLERSLERDLQGMALKVAEGLCLEGIMDLEVIFRDGRLNILEIDARFPSQTPMAVYWSSGVNMMALLAELFTGKTPLATPGETKYTMIEHVAVNGSSVEICGEHIMGEQGPLRLLKAFHGADEALTSYRQGTGRWVATLVFSAGSREEVEMKHRQCLDDIYAKATVEVP